MKDFSRREFLGIGAAATAGILLTGCGGSGEEAVDLNLPPLLDIAPAGAPIRAALVGCGGRGTGAALNFLDAGPDLQIVAVADVFQDRIDDCLKKLKEEKGVEIPASMQFAGFDGFKHALDANIELVILATPPHFRPEHFAAAVAAKKHVFMEKPVAVDPAGARSIIASSRRAESLGLCVGTGTQRRHQRDYVETYRRVRQGAIGDIVAANCYWNQSQLWYKTQQPEWSEMEYMIRDWVNWCWLSGDHIVEQHIHNIDVVNWFTGKHPVAAVGFGARHRRVTGDQFDFFDIDFTYENDVHVHSMCRQINGCVNNVSELIRGTKGYTNCQNTIYDMEGNIVWQYEYPKNEQGESTDVVAISPYVQEHIDLVTAIRTGKQVVEAEATAISTLSAIIGRMSAYTGQEITWEAAMSNEMRLGPEDYHMGAVAVEKNVPVPGSLT